MDHVYWPILTVVGSFVGASLSAYVTTRLKNLATYQDIEKLAKQISVVTRTTEEIKGEISSNLWDRQKRWETRKEILIGAVRNVARAHSILADTVVSIGHIDCAKTDDDKSAALLKARECTDQCKGMATTLSEALALVDLVSGKAVVSAFAKVTNTFYAAAEFLTIESIGAAEGKVRELGSAMDGLYSSIRAELNMPFD